MEKVLKNKVLTVKIASKGAEPQSLFRNDLNYEFLWQGDAKFWTGRSPILFPFVGRLKDSKYMANQQKFTIPSHGFARHQEFELQQLSDTELVAILRANSDTLIEYPYQFYFEISYRLIDNELKITYRVKNEGQQKMWFTLGLHPAFNLDDSIENSEIELDDEKLLSTLKIEEGYFVPSNQDYGRKIFHLKEGIFDNDAVVFDNLTSKKARLQFKNSPRKVTMTWSEDFSILAFWSKPQAPYVCIEPWIGRSDNLDAMLEDISQKQGIIALQAEEEFYAYSSIILE